MRHLNISRHKLLFNLSALTLTNYGLRTIYNHRAFRENTKLALVSHQNQSHQFAFETNEMIQSEMKYHGTYSLGCKCDNFQRQEFSIDNSFDNNSTLKNEFLQSRKTILLRKAKQEKSHRSQLFMVDGSVPIRYPVVGVNCVPYAVVSLSGIRLIYDLDLLHPDELEDQEALEMELVVGGGRGVLHVSSEVEHVHVDGQATNSINIRAHTLAHLNKQLQFVVYENSVLISKPQTDFVRISWNGYSVRVPISIKPKIPPNFVINHHIKPDFSKLVTFVTKTYLRSTCVKNLAAGIRKYYPENRLLIADDSPSVENVKNQKLESYFKSDEFTSVIRLPVDKGWNSGRNALISQVETEFFIWVDDDFVINFDSNIEGLLEVAVLSKLDIIGGKVMNKEGKNRQWGDSSTLRFRWGSSEDGHCLSRYKGSFIAPIETIGVHLGSLIGVQLPDDADCVRAHVTKNFFIAKTSTIAKIGGFDNSFKRVGHLEFFMDAFFEGLSVAVCKHVSVGHSKCATDDWRYNQRRYLTDTDKNKFHRDLLFRRNLKCVSEPKEA